MKPHSLGKPVVVLIALAVVAAGSSVALNRGAGAATASTATASTTVDTASTILRLTEGTNIAATASAKDPKTVVFDLQGVLWSVPFAGGTATALTDPLFEPARPDFSPAGDFLAVQSYAGGTFHIWTMKPDGSAITQLTDGHGDDRDPRVSPDGKRIAFSSDRAFEGSYDIWTVDVATKALTRITSGPADEFEPAWSPDGLLTWVSGTGSFGTTLQAQTAGGGTRTVLTAPAGFRINSPSISPDGARIAYVQFANNKSQLMVSGTQVGKSNDVFPFYPVWLANDRLLYTADGHIQTSALDGTGAAQIPFQAAYTLQRPAFKRKKFDFDSRAPRQALGIVGPQLSPDGKSIVFQALNQLWLLPIGDKPEQLTFDSYYKEDPAWSPDGTRIAYSSDKGGIESIYILDLATGQETKLASIGGAQYSAAWRSEGDIIAFQDQTGATYSVGIGSTDVRKVIPPLFAPGKPSWAHNGSTIAVAALDPYTHRFREGTSRILTVDLFTGTLTYSEPMPFESLSTRGEDGPVYSPDGSAVAFVMQSTLWVRPVDSAGVVTGTARQITKEVTDAPSWSGDSKQLLYLSNGALRLVNRDGTGAQTVPLDLSWIRDRPNARSIIHAGRVWNGLGKAVQTDMDITVVNNRITKIASHNPRTDKDPNAQHIDATSLTVIPGLWESHTHEFIAGKAYGARLGRLWLSYGVTTLNSVGDPAYRAAETREAYASGARVGPRFFATGEAIDGERVYYNFMRPVTGGAEQMARELSRSKALDYDMVKTYVRLPHSAQKEIIEFAHANGNYVASHYMLPSIAFGEDGQTHVSATTRLGYAYTRSSAGISYRDMIDTFVQSGAFDISTTFNPSLYAEDPAMVDDARLTTLNTPWDQLGLRAKRDAALKTDQTVSLDSLQKEEATVKAIRHAGGTILAGTDSPLDNVATALHLNLRAQVKFGLEPWEALQSATILTAKSVGVADDLGSIEKGKLADLTFVSGDPLTNIKDAANVKMVMRNGRLFTIAELTAPFANPAPSRTQTVRAGKADIRTFNGEYWWHDPEQIRDQEQ